MNQLLYLHMLYGHVVGIRQTARNRVKHLDTFIESYVTRGEDGRFIPVVNGSEVEFYELVLNHSSTQKISLSRQYVVYNELYMADKPERVREAVEPRLGGAQKPHFFSPYKLFEFETHIQNGTPLRLALNVLGYLPDRYPSLTYEQTLFQIKNPKTLDAIYEYLLPLQRNQHYRNNLVVRLGGTPAATQAQLDEWLPPHPYLLNLYNNSKTLGVITDYTQPKLLEHLIAHHPSSEIYSHPNISEEVMKNVAYNGSGLEQYNVLLNRNIPTALVKHIYENTSSGDVRALAARKLQLGEPQD